MSDTIFASTWQRLKNLIDYAPPAGPAPFVLDEQRPYDSWQPRSRSPTRRKTPAAISPP
jgi:hypothetical protein